MRARVLAALCACAAATGCLDKAATTCADGTICPLDRVCVAGGCALPEQLDVCDGQLEGATCTFAGTVGQCVDGLCVGSLCGNGSVDMDEVCDDGNVASGDGCRADCGKLEMCGDAILDVNEGCDDGDDNPANGCDACTPTGWTATAIIGGNANATATVLRRPTGMAVDKRGNVYVTDVDGYRVMRFDTAGVLTTIAGNGTFGFSGDGGPGTSAQLRSPNAVAVDGTGNVFIADGFTDRIRRVDPQGTITTVAGGGSSLADGVPATAADLASVNGVAVDGLGNIYIADTNHHKIRMVDTTGVISTVAGTTLGFSGDGGPATSAQLDAPEGVVVTASGRVYIADTGNNRIRMVENGIITTVAGASDCSFGGSCAGGWSGDGGPATAALLDYPMAVALDGAGGYYIADADSSHIRHVNGSNTITTIAGVATSGFSGDGGPAVAAELENASGVAADTAGNVYIADTYNYRVRRIAPTGIITTVAGTGSAAYTGDGGWGTSGAVSDTGGMVVDAAGNLYIADAAHHRVRRLSPQGIIITIAGTGDEGYRASDEGQPAVSAWLDRPRDLAFDAAGNLFIADSGNHRIRKIDSTGNITTVAGNGSPAYDGDGALATTRSLNTPGGIAFAANGDLLIADTQHDRVRRIDSAGIITTIAGTGVNGFGGDNQAATGARLFWPWGITVRAGEITFADSGNNRVRRIDATGKINTIAGTGTYGYNGDGGSATTAQLASPRDIVFDASGGLVIADRANQRVRRIDLAGKISTIAGAGLAGVSGDGGPATSARVTDPASVAYDTTGNLYVGNLSGPRVRRVDTSGTITTIAGQVDPENMGPRAQARLADPQSYLVTPTFTLVAGGLSGTLQLVRADTVDVGAGRYNQEVATGALARYRSTAFGFVGGVAYDEATSSIYLTESGANRIHVITAADPANPSTWTIAPFANASGTAGATDGPIASATFRNPTGLFLDNAAHRLYVADTGNHAIRVIDLGAGIGAATVSTPIGTAATRGYLGDGGPPNTALLFGPRAITRCSNGDLFIADTGNHRVRRVDAATNKISTVLGDGIAASSGEGAPASSFPVHAPRELACDAYGDLLVTSSTTVRMLPASGTGIVDGKGSVETIYGAAPRTTFPASVTNCLAGMAVIDATTLHVTDSCTGLVLELKRAPL